jgi:hypothetical protein
LSVIAPVNDRHRWLQLPNGCKVAAVNRTLTLAALLLFLTSVVVCQTQSHASDCSTLKYLRHKASCLCGTVQICSRDICGRPADHELDDDIAVELRDKSGTTLDTQKVVVETREKQGTTQNGTKTSYKQTERRFCFEGKRDGNYLLAFVLRKKGIPQPAVISPRTTPTNEANLATLCTWWNRSARGRSAKNRQSTHHSRSKHVMP